MKSIAVFAVLFLAGHIAVAPGQQRSATDLLAHALRLADAYNWADAGPEFVEAERLFLAQGDSKNALWARLGKMRSTIAHGALPEVILDLGTELASNPHLQADRRLRMFCLIVKGDFDGESDHASMTRDWEEVRAIARELGDQKWEHRADAQLGIAAYYNADLPAAREYVGSALSAAGAIGDRPGQMLELAILANGFIEAKLYGQALPLLDQSIKLAGQDSDIGYPHVAYQFRVAALIGLGQWDAAQRLADEMLTFARERHGNALEAAVLVASAQIAHARKDDATAIALLENSTRISTAGGYLATLNAAQNLLAEIYLQKRDLAKAEHFANEAAASAQARGDFITLPARLDTVAQLKAEQGRYGEAAEVYRRAGDFVDSMVGKSEAVQDKIALLAASSDMYKHHFALIADRFNDPRRAYGIIEQVRGRVMSDLLASGSFTPAAAKQASKDAARLRLQLMAARSNAEVRRLSDRIFLLEQSHWVAPDVSVLAAKSREQVSIARLQRSLPPSTAILEYVVADPRSYCLVITRSRARIVPLDSGTAIDRETGAYLKAVKAKQSAEDEARRLYATLLKPIDEATENEHLVVVRDGRLHLLPFDAFVDGSGKFIAETKIVTYSPSASTFYLLRRSRTRAASERALLGVGGVPYDSNSLRKPGAARGYEVGGLLNLAASKYELEAAANALQNRSKTLLLGAEATESAFKRSPLRSYRVLHLAVHGLANRVQPDRAALLMVSDPSAGEDGFLQASEIVQLRINADLVVLSACDTAVGPISGEEGIATLSRAFLLAGARTVVSTLWSLDDPTALLLMRQFYSHLGEHQTADRALAEAKRDVIRKFGRKAIPYYWAPYTFEGAGDRTTL